MVNNILEISSRTSKGGRVPIAIALLKIHEDIAETNVNGIHWDETYVTNAIDSVNLMPLCAEFVTEEKDIPYGHGFTGNVVNDNGLEEPEFLNSETVGVIESAAIEEIADGDSTIKVLVGRGYLYSQRYPNFVKWVRTNYAQGKIDTSIELMGKEENGNKIIYLEDNPTKEYRTPVDFIFTGSAILSVEPADPYAVVLEVAQKQVNTKEDSENMEFNMEEVKSVIQSTISEMNNKEAQFMSQIEELNEQIKEKDSTIASQEGTISELNATVEQVQKALKDLEEEHKCYWEEREALEKELGRLKAEARLAEMNEAIKEFTEEEKAYATAEINSFNENPMEGNVDAIVSKIYAGIGQASKVAEQNARVAEQNSAKQTTVVDIFSEVCTETHADDVDVDIFN